MLTYSMFLGVVFKDRTATTGVNPDNLTLPGYASSCLVSIGGQDYYGTAIAFGDRNSFFGQILVSSSYILFRRNADQGSQTFGAWKVLGG